MQKGLATLEIILIMLIIAVLASAAIPNAVRMIDTVALDYETKKLYTDLRLLQELNMSGSVKATGTGRKDMSFGDSLYMNFTFEPSSYQIVRGANVYSPAVREPHYLSNGIKISFKTSVDRNAISSNEFGHMTNVLGKSLSNSLILTSRLDQKNYIVFDSVGRIRGSLTDDY